MTDVEYKIVTILRQVYRMSLDDRSALKDIKLTMMIAEAQRLQDDIPKNSKRFCAAIRDNIAELATIAGPMNQLALLHISYHNRDIDLGVRSFHDLFSGKARPFPFLQYNPGLDYKKAEFMKHCGNDPTFFRYPNHGPKTREKIDEMRRTESKVDLLWSKFDEWIDQLGIAPIPGDPGPMRVPRRTEPWSDPKLKSLESKSVSQQSLRSLSDIYRDLELNTERTLLPASSVRTLAKIKLKTQGTSIHHDSSDEHPASAHSSAPAVQPVPGSGATVATPSSAKIQVNVRASKTFRALFFDPSASATPGDIPWTDFLYAMSSAGFRAEKMYGSAWKFDPVEASCDTTSTAADGPGSNTRSSIIFHEPHPSNKIPYTTARRHGRRLARAYGWSGETFVLAEKEKGAPVGQKEKGKETA
jgi:hypothetical protein